VSAWKPGDVAMVTAEWKRGETSAAKAKKVIDGWERLDNDSYARAGDTLAARPLVVIDPDDMAAVERLQDCYIAAENKGLSGLSMQAALREFANPQPPTEPTDPRARVEDRRENIWRLLADGDWVCTSGPDIGEYIAWSRLAAERGPLAIEVIA
jgi:hypothetical protein